MNIRYAEEKCFTQEQVQALFRSVGWVSGEYPSRLHKALMHSSTVITAWDGDRLVGLVRLLDDREYIEIMPEESKNASVLPAVWVQNHGGRRADAAVQLRR